MGKFGGETAAEATEPIFPYRATTRELLHYGKILGLGRVAVGKISIDMCRSCMRCGKPFSYTGCTQVSDIEINKHLLLVKLQLIEAFPTGLWVLRTHAVVGKRLWEIWR